MITALPLDYVCNEYTAHLCQFHAYEYKHNMEMQICSQKKDQLQTDLLSRSNRPAFAGS